MRIRSGSASKQSAGIDHSSYYIAEKGYGAKQPGVLVINTGVCGNPTDEYRLVMSNYNYDSGWTYIPIDDRVYPP
jgi:hypothetical protein